MPTAIRWNNTIKMQLQSIISLKKSTFESVQYVNNPRNRIHDAAKEIKIQMPKKEIYGLDMFIYLVFHQVAWSIVKMAICWKRKYIFMGVLRYKRWEIYDISEWKKVEKDDNITFSSISSEIFTNKFTRHFAEISILLIIRTYLKY